MLKLPLTWGIFGDRLGLLYDLSPTPPHTKYLPFIALALSAPIVDKQTSQFKFIIALCYNEIMWL